MNKKIITIDCDNVLSDTNNYFVDWFNKNYEEQVTYEEVTDPYFGRYICNKYPHIHEHEYEFYKIFAKDFYGDIQPHIIPGSQEGIQKLKELGYDLYVLTGRGDSDAAVTQARIEKYYLGMFTDIIYNNENTNKYITKGEICKKLGAVIHVDDFLHNAMSISKQGITTLLFDTPWNQSDDILPGTVKRISGWEDVSDYV